MRITFLLPSGAPRPTGGYKVVYEYANALAARGHAVTVVHSAYMPAEGIGRGRALRSQLLGFPLKGLVGAWRPDRWFRVDPRVRLSWIPSLKSWLVPDGDAIFATWWQTAETLAAWPARKGRKFYLVQHLETWGGPEARVMATWRLPLTKIVISRWLEDIGRELGEHCHYVPNGLDFQAFGIDNDPAGRPPGSVAMLYHPQPWKGSQDGLEALQLARRELPNLRVELFGATAAPPGLPDWIAYHQNLPQPALRAVYNRAAIFVGPSWTEGWGLPPCEAMMCGCALACTDIDGHREFARHADTALMSPPRDPVALARNIIRLATDDDLRARLAARGHEFVQQFTWQRAADALERVVTDAVRTAPVG